MTAHRESKAIDGWLLVFLALCVLTSLIYLVMFATARNEMAAYEFRHGPMPGALHVWSWCMAIPRIILPLLILWRMIVDRRWNTVRLAIALLWLLFVGLTLIDIAGAWLTIGLWDGAVHVATPRIVRGIFLAASASLYLLHAKRVAATYPRDTEAARLHAVFE